MDSLDKEYKRKLRGWSWRFRRFLYKLEERTDLTDDELNDMIEWYKNEHPRPEPE
jgi:hypothetical protein